MRCGVAPWESCRGVLAPCVGSAPEGAVAVSRHAVVWRAVLRDVVAWCGVAMPGCRGVVCHAGMRWGASHAVPRDVGPCGGVL